MKILDLIDANDFVTAAILDGVNYKLHFSWNDGGDEGFWTIDLRDSGNSDIIRGLKLVPNFPLLNQYRRLSDKIPRGEFLVVVVNQTMTVNQTIPRDGFSKGTFSLIYLPAEELKSVLAENVSNSFS